MGLDLPTKLSLPIAFEKVILIAMIAGIWITVLLMEKYVPHQSAALIVLGLIVLYTSLISLANLHRRRKIARGMSLVAASPHYQPRVSLVVAAHNEALVIADTVRNLMAIDYAHYDLWIFDDRSTDATGAILQQLTVEYPERFYVVTRAPDAIPGKSAVLNDALEAVEGNVLVVFDADGRVAPDFLNKALPYLANVDVGAVQVRKVIMNAQTNLLTRCQAHEYFMDAHFQLGRDTIHGAVELRGNGQLVKREALDSVDGWTEDTLTDDLDLSTKLHLEGWDIRFAPDIVVEEEGVIRFKALLRQRRRWAEGSLKRYLEHSVDIFTSPYASKRTLMDMLAYFLKFLFPLWAFADITVQVLNLLFGEWPGHLMSTLIILPTMCAFFMSAAFVAMRHYERASILHSLIWAVETGIFLLIVWVPVVMWITTKVLVSRDEGPLNWGKTERLGIQLAVKQSRLQRLKAFSKKLTHRL